MKAHGLHSNWWLETLRSNLEDANLERHEFVKVTADLLDFDCDSLDINRATFGEIRASHFPPDPDLVRSIKLRT